MPSNSSIPAPRTRAVSDIPFYTSYTHRCSSWKRPVISDSDVHPRGALHARQRVVRRAPEGKFRVRRATARLPQMGGRSWVRRCRAARRHREPDWTEGDGIRGRSVCVNVSASEGSMIIMVLFLSVNL
jgi:hypothetical protein